MDPLTIATILGQVAPFGLALFGGQKEKDPTEVFNQLNGLLGAQFQPILEAMLSLAQSEGTRVGQDIAGSVGRSAGGGTGAGAVARSVGAGLGSSMASKARLGVSQAQLQALAQLFPQFMNPGMEVPGKLQNFQSALGLSLVGGNNPFMEIANLFGGAPKVAARRKTTVTPSSYSSNPPPSFSLPVGMEAPR